MVEEEINKVINEFAGTPFEDSDFTIFKEKIWRAIDSLLSLQKIRTLEEVVERYGHYNDGCGCCMMNELKDAIKEDLLAKLTSLKQG